ncbi:hypothetical protein P5V15_000664 [Pogonomyrmex californicus]
MNIVCVICSDLLVPSDDVFHTPCGHIFHYACLVQWLERSKSCPQCRDKTTEHKIRRIYFNFSNSDSIVEDATSLQEKIDNLTFQVKVRDENLKKLTKANEKLEKQTTGLRHEVRKVESEMSSKNNAIHALKEQIKFCKQQCSDIDNYKKENAHLKKNLEHLKNVQTLVDSSVKEVDDVITMMHDTSKLITYIAVLKKELNEVCDKSKQIRDNYKSLQQEFKQISTQNKFLSEEHTKRKELEEQLIICESEKISLQNQLFNMQADAHECICNKTKKKKQESLETYVECDKSNEAINKSVVKLDDSSKFNKSDSCIIIDSDDTKNTPQSIKSQGFFSMKNYGIKRQQSSLKVPSILTKKSRFNEPSKKIASRSDMCFDGFGGHAKYDKFPNPIPNSHVKKI